MKTLKKIAKNDGDSCPGSPALLPMLPPCRVCGEKASGFHYGVNTCEACKAFFRRNLEKGSTYRCIENGNCEILPGKRNSCAACRFNKCISLGMCKEAIKTGRYTHEKKAKDIKEVKELEGNCPEQVSSTNSPNGPKQMPLKPVLPCVTMTEEELQSIVDAVVTAFNTNSPYTKEFFSSLASREQKFLEQKALRQKVFGPMKAIPDEEYEQILQATGIDVDGRKELFQAEIPHIEQSIRRFITFAKAIPGFSRLCVDDQVTIIKKGKFEAWMINCHQAFNPEHRLYATPSGRIIDFDEWVQLCNKEFHEALFEMQVKLRKLDLVQEEACIFAALTVMLTDDCVIQDVKIVEDTQAVLLRCLCYLFNKLGHNESLRFAQFISCLVQLRTLKKLHLLVEEKMKRDWIGKIEFPPLFYEMWSS